MIKPELFDSVELLIDLPEENLRAGDGGALVHQHDDKNFEVEFMNDEGETLALVTLNINQFIVVWRNATHEAVPEEERIAELIYTLPESKRREVLDFARFLHERRSQYEAKPTATSQ